MNKIKNILVVILMAVATFSCSQEFIEEVPKSQLSPENYYQTAEHAESAVIGAYAGLQHQGVYGRWQMYIATDLQTPGYWSNHGGMESYTFNGGTQTIVEFWKGHYQGINSINAAITNIPNISMNEDRKNTLISEALFLRSLFYFNLSRLFGAVPLIITETASLDNLNVARTPVSEINEKIISDLEFSIQHLGTKSSQADGRATVGAAKMLLAKIHLTRGSLAKRDNTGDGISDFQMAAQYASEVIQEGEHELNAYYPDAFIVDKQDNNTETIFKVNFKGPGTGEGGMIGLPMGLAGPSRLGGAWGTIYSTRFYHTLFENDSDVRYDWNTTQNRVKGDGTLEIIDKSLWWYGRYIGKFRNWPLRNPEFVDNDNSRSWPVFRLAETYLILAEALNEVNMGPNEEAFEALNVLRRRASVKNIGTVHDDLLPRDLTFRSDILPDISFSDYPDYESLLDYIKDDRARELGGEHKRWFDLNRWGILVSQIKHLSTFVVPPFNRVETGWLNGDNIKDFHILFPIPDAELNINNLLTQNPGY